MTPVAAPNEPQTRSRLVAEGMRYLKRPIRKQANGDREFLATLVVEAGFPSRLISEQKNWLTGYVEAVTLATSQGDGSLEAATLHAEFFQFRIPPSFRAQSLFHLTADLAHGIAELRRRIADAGITEGAIEWLDGVDPGWRAALPVETSEDAARRLVEGLVRASPRKAVLPVSCYRVLRRNRQGQWGFGLVMEIEGRLDDSDLPAEARALLSAASRARLLPTGALARAGLPAVGVADRTTDEDWRGWVVRSLLRDRPIVIDEFPLDEDARLVFTVNGAIVAEFVPKGGVRVTSDVLVFRPASHADDGQPPASCTLVGTGSLKERERRLFLAVPTGSEVKPNSGAEIHELARFDGRTLLSLQGEATVSFGGDSYVVHAGAAQSESASIDTVGSTPAGVVANAPIYLGCPTFHLHRGPLRSKGDHKTLRMRIFGRGEKWSIFDPTRLPLGLVDIGALDSQGSVLDRLTLIHLPKTAQFRVSVPARGSCRVEVSGLDTDIVEPLDRQSEARPTIITRSRHQHEIAVVTSGSRNTDLRIRVRWPASEILLSIPVLVDKLAFYDHDGQPIPNHASLALAGLRGASIDAVGEATVLIGLHERGQSSRMLAMERRFDRSLPFSQIRDDIERLFAMTDDLDAEVRVEALHAGASVTIIHVRRFDVSLEPRGVGTKSEVTLTSESVKQLEREGAVEVHALGRPFKDLAGPDRELIASSRTEKTHWLVPDGEGPWFVYAKVGGITRSRPLHVNRTVPEGSGQNPFLASVMTANRADREERVCTLLKEIGAGRDPASRNLLVESFGTLDPALPPQAFDVFRLLPRAPTAAVQMAVNSRPDLLPNITDLDEKIPLSWFTSSISSWTSALKEYRSDNLRKFADVGIAEPMANELAGSAVKLRIRELARLKPSLSVHLAVALRVLQFDPDPTGPEMLRQAFRSLCMPAEATSVLVELCRQLASTVRSNNDGRTWPTTIGFRSHFPNLITATFDAMPWAYPVLDAPHAAASIALGEVLWSSDIQRMISVCRTFDPSYFDDAYLFGLTIGWVKQRDNSAAAA